MAKGRQVEMIRDGKSFHTPHARMHGTFFAAPLQTCENFLYPPPSLCINSKSPPCEPLRILQLQP